MTPLTMAVAAALCVGILVLPQRLLLLPIIVGIYFIPADQSLVLGGAHFYVSQLMVISGIGRILLRGETKAIKMNWVDTLVVLWALVGAVIYILHDMDFRAVNWKCGRVLELLGLYWIFRQSTRSWEDVERIITCMMVCTLLLLPFVVKENLTGMNPFARMGRAATAWREGELRCAASFPHPIMFGSAAAALVPMCWSMIKQKRQRILGASSCAVSAYFVLACASSGPLLALMGGVVLLFGMFRYRRHGKRIAVILAAVVLAMQVLMNAPVWYLIARVGVVAGSTGWHRANLIQQAVDHIGDWWLLGTRDVESWGVWKGDVTNQFILEGIWGGLATMLIFAALITVCVWALGTYSLRAPSQARQWLAWAICVSVLVHCISFMSVAYFGQISIMLYWTFAVAAWTCGQLGTGEMRITGAVDNVAARKS